MNTKRMLPREARGEVSARPALAVKPNCSSLCYTLGKHCLATPKSATQLVRRTLSALVVRISLFLGFYSPSFAQNPIVTENDLLGTPASVWDVSGAGDLSIQGFATDISYNKGETARFKITSPSSFQIQVYRLGYYKGNGARLIADVGTFNAMAQPACLSEAATGLIDCGNWAESASWPIPNDAVSGIYIAKLTRTDNGGASHITFIVRDDASTSDLYFKTSDATWQAYNGYGGNSLYTGSVAGFPSGHAPKVSYNRPFLTRNGGAGGGPAEDWVFNAEYPMIRWLERNGYNVTYTTDVDADRRGNLIQNHKIFLSVGHDEYWSATERTNVETARNAGVHLAFFSGNEVYWKTRWEPSIDGSNTDFRTLVCYKEGNVGENTCGGKCDPLADVWTGLWRSGCAPTYTTDACLPENALTGQISWDGTTHSMDVPDTYKNLRFWRNTSIANIGAGQQVTLPFGVLGYEWDWEQPQFQASYPQGRILLSRSQRNGRTHHLSLYRHTNGALVFGAGTVQWSWGLDANHDRGNEPESVVMQQATVNLFADMGVQPATLQSNLVAATASKDNQAPTTVFTNPLNNTTVNSGNNVTINGTATDQGGVIAGVEVSTDGGITWQLANVTQLANTTTWSFNWVPTLQGATTLQSRAFDDSGNIGAPTSITVTVAEPLPPTCPCSIFQLADAPAFPLKNDQNGGIQVGVKFRSTVDGYITGLRYYKGAGTTGTHTGQLYSSSGTLLAEAIFSGETASGWQQVSFTNPVAVTANTIYIASQHSSSGDYASTENYFNQEVVNGYLLGLQSIANNANGVYLYTNTPALPTQSFMASNYWVDVVFELTAGPDETPPTVQATAPTNNASGIAINAAVNVTFSEAIDPTTLTSATFELRDPTNNLVPTSSSYNAASRTATLTPTTPLTYASTYTARVLGGASDPRIKDVAGNALAANVTWTFTTTAPPPLPPTDGPGGPILVISAASNPFSRYPVEILRAEGLNTFFAMDISQVNATVLNGYDVVLLGEIPLDATQVTLLTDWVNAGGVLIAFRPDADLAPLLGLTPTAGNLTEGYLQIANSGAGLGIVNQTLQFHGTADYYTLNGATSLATLFTNAATATVYPAVTSNNVGTNGGKALAFTYDLARSIIYTRQGNPAWQGQNRDGNVTDGVIRSNDLYYGNSPSDQQPDWIDFSKVQIPQADEQQRFLANIIIQNNLPRRPLPRFWYLPKRLKAAVVMTGDDHAGGLTDEFFEDFIALSTPGCSVQDWECVRGTSYVYTTTSIGQQGALAYQNLGFEVGIHINTGCNVWTPASLVGDYNTQLAQFASNFPGITAPCTHRTHCIAWSDWATQPKEEAARGIRLDANYYYWPGLWLQNRPGLFTGSGLPMRFADLDGTLIDCYQLNTQFTDESDQDIALHINTLLDNAIGAPGYYGTFCANMHTDRQSSRALANTIIQAAQARNVPTISAKQLLEWLDGRNGSSFENIIWNNNQLTFAIEVSAGARNLYAMLPVNASLGTLSQLTANNNNPVSFTTEMIKGINYAFFPAAAGNYVATYTLPVTSTLSGNVTLQGRLNHSASLTVKLYTPGTGTQVGSNYTVTTDASGNFTLPNLPAGTYDIYVKKDNFLQKKLANVTLSGNANFNGNFGQLLAGDTNGDNRVNILDFSLLSPSFGKLLGQSGYEVRADFNGDNRITILDFSLLSFNFIQSGEAP